MISQAKPKIIKSDYFFTQKIFSPVAASLQFQHSEKWKLEFSNKVCEFFIYLIDLKLSFKQLKSERQSEL